MPRKARDERLDTRTARLKLEPRREPYWRNIQEGRAIGYRRIAGRAGTWIARHYDPAREQSRLFKALGTADDMLDADGISTLTFPQAQDKAAAWFVEVGRQGGRVAAPITVAMAIADYLEDYRARGGKGAAGVQQTAETHILPKLGDKLVADLSPGTLRAWHRSLAVAAPRVRSKPGMVATRKVDASDAEATRARRSTANRILTVLKAALNLAYRDGRAPNPDAWHRITPFRNVEAPRIRFLTDAEAVRLINAAEPSFRPLIVAALLTGARYGELTRMRAADFNPDAGTVHVRVTKTGKARHIMLTDEGVQFFRQRAAGKSGVSLLFRRADGEEWAKSDQHRPMRMSCQRAAISPPVGFHILRHTHASRLAMAGVPLSVIAAQLGNGETICAKHYAHLSPGYVADSIRAAFRPLGVVGESNVIPMTG